MKEFMSGNTNCGVRHSSQRTWWPRCGGSSRERAPTTGTSSNARQWNTNRGFDGENENVMDRGGTPPDVRPRVVGAGLTGDWQGTLGAAPRQLRVILHIEKADGSAWKA